MAFHRNKLLEINDGSDIDEYFYFEDDNAVAECYSSDDSDLSEAEEEFTNCEIDIINRFLLDYNTPSDFHDHDSQAHPSRKVPTTSSACWPSHQPSLDDTGTTT